MKEKEMRRSLGRTAATLTASLLPVALFAGAASAAQKSVAQAVRHELVMLPYYSIFDNLAYRVDGATVTLYGEVTRPTLKSDAERAVKHIEGVNQVLNKIEVLPLSPFDDRIRMAEYRAIFGYGPMY